MTGAPPETVGDRVERAIERHADVAGEIARGERETPKPRRLKRNIIWLGITAVSLYVVFPEIVDVFSSWKQITRFSLGWLGVMLLLQVGTNACLWDLQRVALRAPRWRPVIASQLASNALSNVAPGGGPVGAALQYRMLVQSGLPGPQTAAALTAVNVLVFAVVLALPVLALPGLVKNGVNRSLLEAGIIAIVAFAVLAGMGALFLTTNRPLAWIGRVVQRVRNRLRRKRKPVTTLPERLLRERDRILKTLGPRWKHALLDAVGRWVLDYMTLLAALAALGSHPRPSLVLLAYCGARALANIPITPGGLGFVEAGLTALLALAGVHPGDAVLATFAYRLFSYWLPLPFGLVGLAIAPKARAPAGSASSSGSG
jgi:uncharacterized protein (TIRG00374 family)